MDFARQRKFPSFSKGGVGVDFTLPPALAYSGVIVQKKTFLFNILMLTAGMWHFGG